jgi:hypothetical protein
MRLLILFNGEGGVYLLGAMAWLGSLDADSVRGPLSVHIETNALSGEGSGLNYEPA